MRTATWLLVLVAIGAIARAEPATGTVVISCNEADAALLVDGVLIADRTPAVLTLSAGTHTIEARKAPRIAQKKVIEVIDQQQIKVRFELLMPAAPALPTPAPPPPATGSAAPPALGSAAGSGSAAPPALGSAAGSGAAGSGAAGSGAAGSGAAGSGAAGSGSAAVPPILVSTPTTKAPRCTEGGHEVPCLQGPRCTEGGKPVPCNKNAPPPPPPTPPPPPIVAVATGSGAGSAAAAGSNAAAEPPHVSPGAAALEIATIAAHAVAYVDGAPVHDAPCVLEVEPGEHVVAVYAAGMLPAEAVVRIEVGKRQRVELTPSKQRKRIDVPAP